MTAPLELPGLKVELDKLVYRHGGEQLPPDRPHAFIYYLTIRNESDRTVTLLGRKWVIENADGTRLVVEGDKIVGETPTLAPGGHFSYNSYHVASCDGRVEGSFHGLDEDGARIFVRIPAFDMVIPSA
ncbi:MAG: ApaG domain [Opitutaceae bacterium]|nr:ApaG domain [Opitutaceae bacterium]